LYQVKKMIFSFLLPKLPPHFYQSESFSSQCITKNIIKKITKSKKLEPKSIHSHPRNSLPFFLIQHQKISIRAKGLLRDNTMELLR